MRSLCFILIYCEGVSIKYNRRIQLNVVVSCFTHTTYGSETVIIVFLFDLTSLGIQKNTLSILLLGRQRSHIHFAGASDQTPATYVTKCIRALYNFIEVWYHILNKIQNIYNKVISHTLFYSYTYTDTCFIILIHTRILQNC